MPAHEREAMTAFDGIFNNYRQLTAICDAFQAKVFSRHPALVTCAERCFGCCKLQTVNTLEAFLVYDRIRPIRDELNAIAENEAVSCRLLHDGRCVIYPIRPLICRTHGVPIIGEELTDGRVDCCPLNFQDRTLQDLNREYVLDIELVTENLMRLNLAFCKALGAKRLAAERFFISDILAGKLPKEFATVTFSA